MQVTDYQLPELRFAYCYHVYLHWRTHRRRPYPELEALTASLVHTLVEPLGIHVLTCNSNATETRLLVSLRPEESISTCASKVKGPISKWLRERLGLQHPKNLLARGYFACTSGQSTAAQVNAYLDSQGAHHGYNERVIPPVYVKSYRPEEELEPWWHAEHSCASCNSTSF